MSSCSRVQETAKQAEARSSSALHLTVQVYSRPHLQHPEERTLHSLHAPQHKKRFHPLTTHTLTALHT